MTAFTDSGSSPRMTDFGFYKIPDCSPERLICLRSVLSHLLGPLYTERKFSLFRPGTDNAKTAVVVADERVVEAPVGDGAAGRTEAPAATA